MTVLTSKPTKIQNAYRQDCFNEINAMPLFPNLVANVKRDISDTQLSSLVTSGNAQRLDIVLDYEHKVFHLPSKKETSNYVLKIADDSKDTDIQPLSVWTEHLRTVFARQVLNFEVPWQGIIEANSNTFCLLQPLIDTSRCVPSSFGDMAIRRGLNLSSFTQFVAWLNLCEMVKGSLSVCERLHVLERLFYKCLTNDKLDPNVFILIPRSRKKAFLAPFSAIMPADWCLVRSGDEVPSWENTRRILSPSEFHQLRVTLGVKPAVFQKAAANILFHVTYKIPDYLDKLQSLSNRLFVESPEQERFVTIVEQMKYQHQQQIQQVEALDWYFDLALNAPSASIPSYQLMLIDEMASD